jgi:hypothetical protein
MLELIEAQARKKAPRPKRGLAAVVSEGLGLSLALRLARVTA